MEKIKTIVIKEWGEVFKHRLVLFTVLFIPLLFTGIALGTIFAGTFTGSDMDVTNELPFDTLTELCGNLEGATCFKFYLASQMLLFFMLIPVIIPITIAAYSVVGEKTTRSLEPLLATPITTLELLTGKALAGILPAVAATWLGFLAFIIGVFILDPILFRPLLRPMWLLAIFIAGPLMSLLAVCFVLMISSRVTDPRAAEQLSAIVVVPMILLIMGQSIGLFVIDGQSVLIFSGLLILIDVGLFYLAIQMFQRETILTKWK